MKSARRQERSSACYADASLLERERVRDVDRLRPVERRERRRRDQAHDAVTGRRAFELAGERRRLDGAARVDGDAHVGDAVDLEPLVTGHHAILQASQRRAQLLDRPGRACRSAPREPPRRPSSASPPRRVGLRRRLVVRRLGAVGGSLVGGAGGRRRGAAPPRPRRGRLGGRHGGDRRRRESAAAAMTVVARDHAGRRRRLSVRPDSTTGTTTGRRAIGSICTGGAAGSATATGADAGAAMATDVRSADEPATSAPGSRHRSGQAPAPRRIPPRATSTTAPPTAARDRRSAHPTTESPSDHARQLGPSFVAAWVPAPVGAPPPPVPSCRQVARLAAATRAGRSTVLGPAGSVIHGEPCLVRVLSHSQLLYRAVRFPSRVFYKFAFDPPHSARRAVWPPGSTLVFWAPARARFRHAGRWSCRASDGRGTHVTAGVLGEHCLARAWSRRTRSIPARKCRCKAA